MYQAGISAGALGGKLLGAGAGGFMMFFAQEERQPEISKALGSFRQLNFKIENTGSQVIYYAE
jgi:D-glycero-alpha-D-manno-heptose-7-phosphate kinase